MELPLEAMVINLVRRNDRLVYCKLHFPFRFRVIEAFDGSKLPSLFESNALTSDQGKFIELLEAWSANPHEMIPGIFGCWQSHLRVWYDLIFSSEENRKVLVLEDDAIPSKNG